MYSLIDWVAKIKASRLSEVVEEIMEKQDLESGTTYSSASCNNETDLTTMGPPKKRKLDESGEEVSATEVVDLTKNFQKST